MGSGKYDILPDQFADNTVSFRYFECQPNFGLFAPVTKVSKSPSQLKPNQCQLHSPTNRQPPSNLKRAGSKESMTSNLSMISSASATARRVRLGVTSLTAKVGWCLNTF